MRDDEVPMVARVQEQHVRIELAHAPHDGLIGRLVLAVGQVVTWLP